MEVCGGVAWTSKGVCRQGGWRTTEVMKTIYTKLSPKEVDEAFGKVLDSSTLAMELSNSTHPGNKVGMML